MYKKFISIMLVIVSCLSISMLFTGCGSSSGSGNYDTNDYYYKNNDADNDGYINDKEFQNAVGDWMDDNGY